VNFLILYGGEAHQVVRFQQ